MMQSATPGSDRILTLDILRGVAVMGILTMNIVAFAMPQTAYINPAAYGGITGADLVAYVVSFILFDGKMRGLFSFLFGASMLLVIERAEAKGKSAARIHYARMFWLLLFGLAHLWLVWWGDILAHYALVGSIAFLFRRLPIERLVILAAILLLIEALVMANLTWMFTANALAISPEIVRSVARLQNMVGEPLPGYIADRLAVHRGDYAALLADRFRTHLWAPLTYLTLGGWETLAFMLLGMAGLRSGMLSGAWTNRAYRTWLWVGFGVGIPVYALLAALMMASGFSALAVVFGTLFVPVFIRPLMIAGWIAAIILATRRGGWLVERIAAAGRMAFTNYLATSLIMTTLFYGYGGGLFGYLSRAELYLPVLGMWGLMLAWSKPWLARYRYGPLEWLWRTLARLQVQPIRVEARTA